MDYSVALFLFIVVLKFADALVVALVWYACWSLRFDLAFIPAPKGIPSSAEYVAATFPLVLVYVAVFHLIGVYRRDRIHFGFRALRKITQASTLGLLVFIATIYFSGEVYFSRAYLVLFLIVLIPSVLAERLILQMAWNWAQRNWVKKIKLLLVGGGDLMALYVSQLKDREPYPIEWLGRLGDKETAVPLDGLAYLGQEDRLPRLLENLKPDTLVIAYPPDRITQYRNILESVSNELVTVKMIPDFGRYNTFNYNAAQELGVPLLNFNQTPVGATDRALKRLMDLVGAALAAIVFSPVLLVAPILIKLTSKGPVFYSQERVGADGRVFRLYKFRSMRLDAESETGAVWAKQGDMRVTRIGNWLRRTSLDELPQLWNVLKGEMSLVGPRPERPIFVSQFRKKIPKYMLRHKMKSGMTGWAQVNGLRGNTSLEARIQHDLFYIGHWSHLFDIKILFLTVSRGFVHRHAY